MPEPKTGALPLGDAPTLLSERFFREVWGFAQEENYQINDDGENKNGGVIHRLQRPLSSDIASMDKPM